MVTELLTPDKIVKKFGNFYVNQYTSSILHTVRFVLYLYKL